MAFEFFRKYQKIILYTAGIFALLTFSITGAVFGFFAPSAHESFVGARMTLPSGRVVAVTYEDSQIGQQLARIAGRDPAVVLPALPEDETSKEDSLRDRYAALRRLAIEFGIGVSDTEVDRAIEQARSVYARAFGDFETPTRLALGLGYSSLEAYRMVVAEAMRIGTFLRLQALGADLTDAAVAKAVLRDQKMVTLEVAALDEQKIEEKLRENEISDADLLAWIEQLPAAEKRPYQDTNRVSLGAVGVIYADFDPAEWQTELAGKQWTDEELQREYQFRRDRYFKKPESAGNEGNGGAAEQGGAVPSPGGEKPGGNTEQGNTEQGNTEQGGAGEPANTGEQGGKPKGGGEEGAPPQGGKPKGGGGNGGDGQGEGQSPPAGQQPNAGSQPPQAGPQVPPGLQNQGAPNGAPPQGGAAQGKQGNQGKPSPYQPFEAVKDQVLAMVQAEAALDAVRNGPLQQRFLEHMAEPIAKRNDVLREVAEANKALEEAKAKPAGADHDAAVEAAQARVDAAEQAKKAADEALDAARASFDFVAQMMDLIGSRKGVKSAKVSPPTGAAGLEDLGDLGTWRDSFAATSMSAPGDISTQIQRTDKAAFHFQVPEVIANPLRPIEEIAERARADYYTKKAHEQAKEVAEQFDQKLLDLAKTKIADRIAELKQENDKKLDEEFNTWRDELQAKIEEAQHELADIPLGTHIHESWQNRLAELQKQRDDADKKRTEIADRLDKELKTEIEAAARAKAGDVLADAAEGTPFELKTVGPYPEDLSERPRFKERYEGATQYLFGDADAKKAIADLDEGEATDLLDDVADRSYYVAVLKERRPAELRDLTRREIMAARDRLTRQRMSELLQQSFTIAALEERYHYEPARTADEEPKHEPAPSSPKQGDENG